MASAKKAAKPAPAAVKYYLIAYNAATLASWAYVLYLTVSFIATPRSTIAAKINTPTAKGQLLSLFSKASSKIQATTGMKTPSASSHASWSTYLHSLPLPSELLHLPALISQRLSGLYAYKGLGPFLTFTQSAALLEVLHSAVGWVRSDPTTVAMQVASRVWMVWGVVEHRPEAQSSPLFTTMVLAWSFTEVVRSSFYLTSLLNIPASSPISKALVWLRYNTFYVLYPLGAGSEAFLMLEQLPSLQGLPKSLGAQLRRKKGIFGGMTLPKKDAWSTWDLGTGVLFVGWWPALYVLFSHMQKQRSKVFGKGRKLAGEKKAQ